MKVGVVGTGYVGLVTGTCFAEKGNDVMCVDVDQEKVERLRNGDVPIYEPGLEELVKSNVENGRLKFTTDLKEGVDGSSAIFLALPTPEAEDGSADLRHVLGVADKIGGLLTEYAVIVTKSTVPPGTAEKVRAQLSQHVNASLFDVASNPEFLKEGAAINDFQHPDRVVIGVDSEKSWQVLRELYLPFVPNRSEKLVKVGIADAELIKYAANTALAARVALTNEIANISELVGADIRQVMEAVGLDARIGSAFLNPGPGYGGSCFPKDVQALDRTAAEYGYNFMLGKTIHESNQEHKKRLAEKVKSYFGDDLSDKTIAVWGLAFKPNTDDIRETPAINVIDSLTAAGARVVAYDPEAMDNMKKYYSTHDGDLSFALDRYQAVEGSDALVIITDWDEFKSPNWSKLKSSMNAPVIFDGRSLYEPESMLNHGFYYNSIGRKVVNGWKKD